MEKNKIMKKYNIDDVVWYAFVGNRQVQKTCDICYGKLKVNLILGNGTIVELPCNYCGTSYESPRGYITTYEFVAEPKQVKISNINIEQTKTSEKITYYTDYGTIVNNNYIFDTKEEAEIRCNEIIKQEEIDEFAKTEHLKFNNNKSFSWNAGYHLKEVKKHKQQLEYHERKAIICKEKSKDNSNE